ncbi:MAG: glycosyltransferase [Nitrosopumilales archaeon]|nr:MAG: glycosyltransferase [Nitrosopumilales archaeon]
MSEIKTAKIDPLQIILTGGIFGVLFYTVYLMNTNLTFISLAFAAFIMFYQLLSARGNLSSKFKYGKKLPSPFAVMMIALPFVLASVGAYEGFNLWGSPARIIILWGMTITFWSTMMFVPLAVYSKYKEAAVPEPVVYPSVSVLVPAYNEEKVIARTIEGLLETEYPSKEIIVIDDGSKDKTLEVANRYKSQAKVLHKENGGKASALNYGIAFAKGEIVVIVDADTIVGRNALKQIVKGFGIDKKVAAVAGNIKVRNRMNLLTWVQALEYITSIEIVRRAFDFFGSITIVPGALGAFRKSTLEEVGTYHNDTLVEDFDATIKVLKSGFVISGSTTATAYTEAPQSLHDFYKQRKRWYRGNLQVLQRHMETLFNPRYSFLYRIAFPFMIISMVVLPFAGLVVIVTSILEIINGDWLFLLQMFGLFIILQTLMSALAVRIDKEDPRLILFSPFLVLGYKQIVDILLIKGTLEVLFKTKTKWTSAKRIGV